MSKKNNKSIYSNNKTNEINLSLIKLVKIVNNMVFKMTKFNSKTNVFGSKIAPKNDSNISYYIFLYSE